MAIGPFDLVRHMAAIFDRVHRGSVDLAYLADSAQELDLADDLDEALRQSRLDD